MRFFAIREYFRAANRADAGSPLAITVSTNKKTGQSRLSTYSAPTVELRRRRAG
jgi:hypothetical protein